MHDPPRQAFMLIILLVTLIVRFVKLNGMRESDHDKVLSSCCTITRYTCKQLDINWTKVQLMSSCLQVYLVMVQQLDNTLSWSDSLIPFNYTTCTIRVTNRIINMKACLGGSCISLQAFD